MRDFGADPRSARRTALTALRLGVAVAGSAGAFALYSRVQWPWLVLGWIGLVPWLAELDRMHSLRAAFGAGLLMCTGFVLAVFPWFASAIADYTALSTSVALLALPLLAPVLQPQFVTLALARRLAQRAATAAPPSWWYPALVGAGAYVGTEWACPKLFADTLGHGLYASPLLRQAADLAGAHGLTFALIVANEGVLATLQPVRSTRRVAHGRLAPAMSIAMLVLTLLSYGALRDHQLAATDTPSPPVVVAVVQANLSHYDRLANEIGTYEAVRRILDTHFALSNQALQRDAVDFLVWPETVYPTTFGTPKSADGAAFDRAIVGFVAAAGVPLVFGTYEADAGDEFNAIAFLEPPIRKHVRFDTYRKARLFPLTERVPALLDSDLVRRWMPWMGTWKRGAGAAVMSLRLRGGRVLRVAPLVCYDAVVPELALMAVREGAEAIVTLSNDSWFAYGTVPRLILIVSAFRSLETRRPQIRATNTGISAIISPTGEWSDVLGSNQRAILVAPVYPIRRTWTLMLAWGDWFPPTALVAAAVLLVAPALRRRVHSGALTRFGGWV